MKGRDWASVADRWILAAFVAIEVALLCFIVGMLIDIYQHGMAH